MDVLVVAGKFSWSSVEETVDDSTGGVHPGYICPFVEPQSSTPPSSVAIGSTTAVVDQEYEMPTDELLMAGMLWYKQQFGKVAST